jgi:pimeloyl-ACP methyl ester carboxylesterase
VHKPSLRSRVLEWVLWRMRAKSRFEKMDGFRETTINLFEPSKRSSMTIPFDITLPQVNVLDSTMAYREAGDPQAPMVLFLHGNPTSSYIYRKIIPMVAPIAHCMAPDLIGFGQSGKPDIEYRFYDHVRYLDAFIEQAGISSAFVIAQDWGTGLAFHLAARRPEFIRGLAFMEFIRPIPSWDDLPAKGAEIFKKFRTPVVGEENDFREEYVRRADAACGDGPQADG